MSWRKTLIGGAIAVSTMIAVAAAVAWVQLPAIGAGALLYPARRISHHVTPDGCADRRLKGVDVELAVWSCTPHTDNGRPAIVYLHGIADNRDSAVGVIDRFLKQGYKVIAYDSRDHGLSSGDRCTYGYFEKQDLRLILDQLGIDHAILIGHSLGAAVALQAAPDDKRITAVVAVSTFADLRSIAIDRAPAVFAASTIERAFGRAERDGHFRIDDVSPLRAAAKIRVAVLVVHGMEDSETASSHSRRVFDALAGPKKLVLVDHASHNDVLRPDVWRMIDDWMNALP